MKLLKSLGMASTLMVFMDVVGRGRRERRGDRGMFKSRVFGFAAIVGLLLTLAPMRTPAALAQTGGLPSNAPMVLEASKACETLLDRSRELALSDFDVSDTAAGGGLSDVTVNATINNLDIGDFERATAIPHFSGTGIDVEETPAVQPLVFGEIAPHGTAAPNSPMTLRLPTDQVDDLEIALGNGDLSFVVHALERVVLKPDVYIIPWTVEEDIRAIGSPLGLPVWLREDDLPLGLGNLDENGPQRVFVIVDDYRPEYIDQSLWFTEYVDAYWAINRWAVQFEPVDPALDLRDFIVSGTMCTTEVTENRARERAVRINAFDVGPVSVSGQVAGQLIKIHSNVTVRADGTALDLAIETDATVTLQVSAQTTLHVDASAPIPIPITCFPIAAIPTGIGNLQAALTFRHEISVEGDVVAGMVAGLQKRLRGGLRLGYDSRLPEGQRFYSGTFNDPSPIGFTPPRLTDETGVDMRAKVTSEIGLNFGEPCPPLLSVGVHMKTSIYGDLEVFPLQDPWWRLSHGVLIEGGFDVDILGFGLVDLNAPLVDIPGEEIREGSRTAAAAAARMEGVFPEDPVGTESSGDDQRWAVAIDDLGSSYGYSDSAVASLVDNSAIVSGNQLLARFAPNGQLTWARALKFPYLYQAESLLSADEQTFVMAASNNNNGALMAWIDPATGDSLATNEYKVTGTDTNYGCSLEDATSFDDGGEPGYLFVGRAYLPGESQFHYDVCAVRLDADGDVLWAKNYYDPGDDQYTDDLTQYVHGVARTPDGGFALVGTNVWGPDDTGDDVDYSLYNNNSWFLKLEDDGDVAWSKVIATSDYRSEEMYDVAFSESGDWYVVGAGGGTVLDNGGLFLAVIAADGSTADSHLIYQDEAWEQDDDGGDFEPWVDTQGGSTPYDAGLGIVAAPDGFVLTGRAGLSSGVTDGAAMWALKVGTDADIEWFRTWDGDGDDSLNEVTAVGVDGFYTSGYSDSTIPVGSGGTHSLTLLKLGFEGSVEFLPGTGLTARYIEPLDAGFPVSAYNGNHFVGDDFADAPITAADAIVSVTAVTGFVGAAESVCVQLLTEAGAPSLNDGCSDDDDGDAYPAATDNCDDVFNPDQADSDHDGVGDACDGVDDNDDDGDGISNAVDACPNVAEDLDGYLDSDGCPEPGPYVDPCSMTPTITGTNAGERIDGTPGPDVIFALGGNDRIFGHGGGDFICAGPGNDTVTTSAGNDTINLGAGNDRASAGRGLDAIHGLLGNDTIYGGRGVDFIYGDQNDDTLYGQGGRDFIRGGAGNDTCNGGPGRDNVAECSP
jgi:Ca2+-binding RTX toxin-like protein